jgi:hypothetical protein
MRRPGVIPLRPGRRIDAQLHRPSHPHQALAAAASFVARRVRHMAQRDLYGNMWDLIGPAAPVLAAARQGAAGPAS